MERLEFARLLVELNQRFGVLCVHVESLLNRIWIVVVPLDQRLSSHIIPERNARTIEAGVVDPTAGQVNPTTFDPVDDHIVWHVEVYHTIDVVTSLEINCLNKIKKE